MKISLTASLHRFARLLDLRIHCVVVFFLNLAVILVAVVLVLR